MRRKQLSNYRGGGAALEKLEAVAKILLLPLRLPGEQDVDDGASWRRAGTLGQVEASDG